MSAPLTFSSEAIGACQVVRVEGEEGLNQLPRWTIRVISPAPDIDLEAAIGTSASLVIADQDGAGRTLELLIVDAAYSGTTIEGHTYDVTLSSPAWLLTKRSGYRIHQMLNVKGIVSKVLEDAGIPTDQIAWRLAGSLFEREQCVQYGESEWCFVVRLLADEGINYWFDSDADGKAQLVFGDTAQAHETIPGASTLSFEDAAGMASTTSSFFELERTKSVTHEAVHVAEYDPAHPAVLVEGKAGDGPLEYYEYPAWTPDEAAAARRARVRLEQLQRLKEHAIGRSNCVRLQPGRVVTIVGVADDYINGYYLIARVRHTAIQATRAGGGERPYVNECLLIPQDGERTHRPAPPEGAPRVDGMETAIVTGPAGQEIHVDSFGRIKVSFPWDRSGVSDDGSSCWVRTMQWNMEASMMLPRVGWEVPIIYRDGCPDRPFCLGRLYNGKARTPYPLPERKATASLKSATTPADGTINEVALVDVKGSQQMVVAASGNQKVSVGGDSKTTVDAKETYNVVGNYVEHVVGMQQISVAATQTIDVGGACTSKITGARTVITGSENIKTDKNRAVDCSAGYHEAIGGLYFVKCNQSNDAFQGTFTQIVGGAMGVAAGCGVNEVVLGARIEICGGARIVKTGAFKEHAIAAKRVTSAAFTQTAGGAMVTTCKSSATIAAADTKLHASSLLLVSGSNVTITATQLDAGGYSLAGSHSASGHLLHDGSLAFHSGGTKAKS